MRANSLIVAAAVMLFAALVQAQGIDGPDSVDSGKSAVFRVPKSISGEKYSWDVLPKDNLNYLKITEDDGSPAIILLDVDKPVYLSFVSYDKEIHFTRLLTIGGNIPPDNGGGDPPPPDEPPIQVARNIFVLVVTDSNTTEAQKNVFKDASFKQFLSDSKHRLGPYDASSPVIAKYQKWITDYRSKGGVPPIIILVDETNGNVLTTQPLPDTPADLQDLVKKHTRK